MKLYLVHLGFIDDSVHGSYECHINRFIVAASVGAAYKHIKQTDEYQGKNMHVDSIQEVRRVDGHDILLEQVSEDKNTDIASLGYDALKQMSRQSD